MAKSKYGYETETVEETAVAPDEPMSLPPVDPLQAAVDKLMHATTLDLHDRLAAMQTVLLALVAAVKEKTDGNK